jgi:hypothetical protein
MAYKIKTKGRPKSNYKIRGIKGLTPKGFTFHKIVKKKNTLIFKREK